MEILAGGRVQPTRTSPATIFLSLSPVPTTSVYSSVYSIETSARSTLETNKAAGLLPQTRMSPTRTFTPFSNPSTKKKEIAAHSETKKLIRNKRWDSKNETANMTAAAGAGVVSSPHFEQDNRTSYNFSLHTYPSMMPYSGLINCCH